MGNITTILSTIQTTLKAPKNQYNKFGKYNYRSCEDILEALKPIIADLKAALVLDDDLVLIGERYYIKATATLKFEDESISVSAFAREGEDQAGMAPSQLTGATSSYARKYALNGLFCIDDNKDADSTNTHGKDEETPARASKPSNDGLGNLSAPAPKAPQPKPQTASRPQTPPPAPTEPTMTLDEAWEMDGEYAEFKGYPLKVLYKSNPKHLNEVFTEAKKAGNTKLVAAIELIAASMRK